MTTLAIPVFGSGLLNPIPSSSGVSKSAAVLRACVEDTREHLSKSVTISTFFEQSLARLNRVGDEALFAGWDGYGARALDFESYSHALKLLQAFPTSTPVPDVAIEPDGEVELVWSRGPRRMLSVSVSRNGRISYAGLFGENRAYGAEFLGSEIPRAVLENLQRVFSSR